MKPKVTKKSIPQSTAKSRITPAGVASEVRRTLKDGGSAEHAAGVQWFFKDKIKSHGWYTADLRRAARSFRRELRKEFGLDFLVRVADKLFSGAVLEEKVVAIFLLERNLLPNLTSQKSCTCSSLKGAGSGL